jgi:hypothetical protein
MQVLRNLTMKRVVIRQKGKKRKLAAVENHLPPTTMKILHSFLRGGVL